MGERVYVTKIFNDICVAHFLPEHKGKCANYHGHNYRIEITVSRVLPVIPTCLEDAMVVDFSDLKKMVEDNVICLYDHKDITYRFKYSTAECMCREIYKSLELKLRRIGVDIEKVKIYETSTSFAEFCGEVN